MAEQKNKLSSEHLQQALKEKANRIEGHAGALRRELTQIAPTLRGVITERPITSACTALGAGVGIGIILASGRRSSNSYDSELLDAALAPVVAAVRERVDQGNSPEDAIRSALRSQVSPPREGALVQLVRLLMPAVVEIGLNALNNSRGDRAAEQDD